MSTKYTNFNIKEKITLNYPKSAATGFFPGTQEQVQNSTGKQATSVRAFEVLLYEGISKSFEPNMERARNLDLFCFIFQRSPLPTPHTCPI